MLRGWSYYKLNLSNLLALRTSLALPQRHPGILKEWSYWIFVEMEAGVGIEPALTELQSAA